MNQQCPVFVKPGEQSSLRALKQAHDFELCDDLNFSRFSLRSLRADKSEFEFIQVHAYHVSFRGVILDLTNCELTLRLFQLFSLEENHRCTLMDVLKSVYGVSLNLQQSPRYRRSARMRAIKLISRARKLAAAAFADVAGKKREWFAYDHDAKTWSLFKNCDHFVYLQ